VTGQPRGIADLRSLDAVFGALGHQSRRTILLVLLARGGEMTSGEMVHAALRGRQRVYQLDSGRLRSVAGGWLARFDTQVTAPGARLPG
jgi:hypothetical protein